MKLSNKKFPLQKKEKKSMKTYLAKLEGIKIMTS